MIILCQKLVKSGLSQCNTICTRIKSFVSKYICYSKEPTLSERSRVISGFAILYMLLTVPHLLPWNTKGTLVGILSWCHLIGAVSPWVGSFLYHLFMNVNYDEVFYRTLLKVDMIGIWLCQSFGAWCICRWKPLRMKTKTNERTDIRLIRNLCKNYFPYTRLRISSGSVFQTKSATKFLLKRRTSY